MTTYDIRVNQRGSPSVLRLCDVMALGDDDSTGLSYADALAVIKGHVPEGYKVLDTFLLLKLLLLKQLTSQKLGLNFVSG